MLNTISVRLAPPCWGCGRRASIALGTLVALGVSAASLAAEPIRPELTPKLQGLLKKEMIQIELAMQEVYSAILQGHHAVVAEKGKSIHDSFIMEQSLNDQDRQDLKGAVPPEFLKMDSYFHELSASLAEAGRGKDTLQQVEIFGRMTESCVACHSTYVTDQFEGLESSDIPEEWGLSPDVPSDRSEG